MKTWAELSSAPDGKFWSYSELYQKAREGVLRQVHSVPIEGVGTPILDLLSSHFSARNNYLKALRRFEANAPKLAEQHGATHVCYDGRSDDCAGGWYFTRAFFFAPVSKVA